MSGTLEWKKIRRTGFLPALAAGGLLCGAVPILNTAARSELFLKMEGDACSILMGANWNMMAMLNVLLLIIGACILYHIEFGENGMQKMRTLPIREEKIYLGKCVVLGLMSVLILGIEMFSIAFCEAVWFHTLDGHTAVILLQNFGYELLLLLPVILVILVIASAFSNMWITLGIGVVCLFAATMNPGHNFWISLFPFALPFEMLPEAGAGASLFTDQVRSYCMAAGLEIILAGTSEYLYGKIRRKLA